MINYTSPSWVLFATRSTPPLKRDFRKRWYLYIDKITNLKISQLLIICQNGLGFMYVKLKEDKANDHQIIKDYKQHKIKKYFKKFLSLTKKYQKLQNNTLFSAIQSYEMLGSGLIYSHYVERLLTKQSKNPALSELISLNSKLRNAVLEVQDENYKTAYEYLKKKFPLLSNLNYYLVNELLSGKILNQKSIKARKKFYVFIATKNSTCIFIEKEARKILRKEHFKNFLPPKTEQIKGFPVFPGKVKGKVFIAANLSDFKKSGKNKIIVTSMTIPQFNPFLKKHKALVTNEGGINCHASITAREFDIPCVVGTKIATQVFKNGDLVEVDTSKGIVRKLK